ncbi:MAG: ArsA family ATPase [Polyangiales bacterium]
MATLSEVLDTHRVIVTVGSGGVGKTTTAAALALHAAQQGRRVLCMTIDPARRLANSLGLDSMTADEQVVQPRLFVENGLEPKGELFAMMLDARQTFDELVTRTASSPEIAEKILTNKIYQQVAGGLAGTQEYMAMEKLHAVRSDSRYDVIILDTPPTSNALDFLDAPERMVAAIDSPAMRWFVGAFKGAGKLSFGLFGKGASLVFKALSKFTGAGFLEEVAEFVAGLNDLFGGFKERAEEVAGALRSEEVAFVLVTSPAPMAIDEAIFFSTKLGEAQMRRSATVVNGMHTLLREPSISRAEQIKTMGTHDSGVNAEALVDATNTALQDERLRAVADRIESDRLRNKLGGDSIFVEVPRLEQDVHDLGGLSIIAKHLVAEDTTEIQNP